MKPSHTTSKLLLAFAGSVAISVLTACATPHYVDVNGSNATPPFLDWSTAATNIQDAIDAATAGDLILVTNGLYNTGGRLVHGLLTNRVAVTKSVAVQSVNGPAVTTIEGYWTPSTTNGDNAVRCVYLTNGALLSGFTLTNGATRNYSTNHSQEEAGGGVWCESLSATVTNCVITKNSAYYAGGGAFNGTLQNCILSGNRSGLGAGTAYSEVYASMLTANTSPALTPIGGVISFGTVNSCMLVSNSAACAAGSATLNNCTIARNSGVGAMNCFLYNCTVATNSGSGVSQSTLNNCIVYYNSSQNYGNYCVFRYCCTTPLPGGAGNFTNAPLFENLAAADFHLQTSSPCINSGKNSYATNATDLDGNPRIVNGTVDIGAYEFQGSGSLISYAWLQQYGWPTDGSADFADADGDGANNWQEWRADTNPTNALSVLRMVTVANGTPGLQVTWQSVPTRSYWLDRATNLASPPSFSSIASNLAGQVGTTTYADTNAIGPGPFFYRVGVQP